jgi:hypothetical protein
VNTYDPRTTLEAISHNAVAVIGIGGLVRSMAVILSARTDLPMAGCSDQCRSLQWSHAGRCVVRYRPVGTIGIPLALIVAVSQAYRRHRRHQLALMPKGIKQARGVTMRSAIKAARPTSVGR